MPDSPDAYDLLIGVCLKEKRFSDLSATRQTLDMWTGRLASSFVFDGAPVDVETSVHPDRDLIIVRLRSQLLAEGRLGMDLKFPGVSAKLNPDPADWTHPESHSTREIARGPNGLTLARQLDDTRYSVRVASDRELKITEPATHAYRLTSPGSSQITLLVEFAATSPPAPMPAAEEARAAVARGWASYWMNGGVVDLTGSRDPRAKELERRIVMSQYLTAVNSAGDFPPQLERQVPSRDARLARGTLRRMGAAAAARTKHDVLFHAARRRQSASEGAWCSGSVVAEDGGARRAREPEQGESVHHVAAAAPYLPGRDDLQGEADARDAREISRRGVRDRRAARHLAVLRPQGRSLRVGPAHHSGAGELRAAGDLQSHLRARVLAFWPRHRAAVARATRHEEGSKMGQHAVPPLEATGERRRLSRRGIPAGPVGARSLTGMLEGQHEA